MGLARETSDNEAAMAEAGRAYGTPYYISPEQIRGEVHIDHRADLYSLGATWYHMVTGRVPFEGATPSAVMHKHLKEPLTPPDHLNTRLSAGCGAMIETLMAKNRDQRYSSARELLTDLALLARGEPPYHANRNLADDDLGSLTAGDAVPQEQLVVSRKGGRDRHDTAVTLAIVLGAVAAISVLGNLIQLAVG
jgi:serine/threonine-protein kinase